MGENNFASLPVALYGMVLLLAACAYFVLTRVLIASHGSDSVIARALGRDVKGKASTLIYALAIPLAFVRSWISCALYVFVCSGPPHRESLVRPLTRRP
jgi:uncharacterized membrane protein